MFLISLSSASISFLFASMFTTVEAASQLATYVFILQTLLSGFFVSLNQVPSVLRWIQWISPLRYGLSIMFVAEFDGQPGSDAFFAANELNPDMILFYIFILIALILIIRFLAVLALWLRARKATV
jgi:ABC-type multidrug transport system permease subunit